MTKRIWDSEAVSIILLPSGEQGQELLDLAQEWSKSWLLTPAFWMLADEIPNFGNVKGNELPVPPTLWAYLLGRGSDGESVKEKVDAFWVLGSQRFKKIRFIAVRTEQNVELMDRTNRGAIAAAKFFERAVPAPIDASKIDIEGATFLKINLVVSPTNERKLLRGILSEFWDANLVAAAEDRTTPLSTDSFVKEDQRYLGFILAHIATTGGLWAGLPVSSAEINSEKTQLGYARLQRVFVRAITSDTLSANVAQWALQKLDSADGDYQVGYVEGSNVQTIAADSEEIMMNKLVEFIIDGPQDIQGNHPENFRYQEIESEIFDEVIPTWSQTILKMVRDMAEGLTAIPRWVRESWKYRLELSINEVDNEEILYEAIPNRLAPKIKLPAVNTLIESAKPKLSMPSPALWKHVREAISAAIDAPTKDHPSVLLDDSRRLLIFAELDSVLPNPDSVWNPEVFAAGTAVELGPITWIDARAMRETKEAIENRLRELEPGLKDAKQQLTATRNQVDETSSELHKTLEELQYTTLELTEDKNFGLEMAQNHLHDLPEDLVGPKRESPSENENNAGGDDEQVV